MEKLKLLLPNCLKYPLYLEYLLSCCGHKDYHHNKTVNIHNGKNKVCNGPQINNLYTDKELIHAAGQSIETMQRVMDWMQHKGR